MFLAGDAAHVHRPAGGQGMNAGIQDAIHLAGLLAEVFGGADPEVLTRYDRERRPNAAALLAFTGQLTSVAELGDPDTRRLRDDVLAQVRDVPGLTLLLAQRLAQLDVPPAQWP